MNVRYLLCVFFLFTIRGISFCQNESQTNLSLAAEIIGKSLVPLQNELTVLGKDKFYNLIIEGIDDEKQMFLTQVVKSRLQEFKILLNADTAGFGDTIDYIVSIKNPELEIKYVSLFTDNVLGDKKVKRVISVSYELTVTDKETLSQVFSKNIANKGEDSFSLEEQNQVEDKRFNFSQPVLPEEDSINSLLFPAIIIFASAAAIILFFSIRSK